MLPVKLSQRAEFSLQDIVDYYTSKHSVSRASKVVKSIDEGLNAIAKAPNRNPMCFDLETLDSSIRQYIVHNTFKIIYRIEHEQISVIDIFHGKRDPELLKK